MANTTFTGPVRSEGGFQVVSKNATTGAYTDIATIATTFENPQALLPTNM